MWFSCFSGILVRKEIAFLNFQIISLVNKTFIDKFKHFININIWWRINSLCII